MVKHQFGGLDAFVAQLIKGMTNTQAWCALLDEEETHPTMRWPSMRIRACQHCKDAGMDAIRDPQLGTVEHILIAITQRRHRNGLDIAARVGFR